MSDAVVRVLWVGLGGALGSILRYLLGGWVQQSIVLFPLGTLVVNILGCILIGLLSELFLHSTIDPVFRTAVLIGVLGGFTTFSSFSLDTVKLAAEQQYGMAVLNVAASVFCCLGGTLVGLKIGQIWSGS